MEKVELISMSGSGYEKFVMRVSTVIEKCHAEAPAGDLFIIEKVDLPVVAICPIKGDVKIGDTGRCEGPIDGGGCELNYF